MCIRDRFCTADLEDANGDGYPDDSSLGLLDNVEACRDGDMLSCDFVFTTSELDSEFVDLAATCGSRRVLINDTCLRQYGPTAE